MTTPETEASPRAQACDAGAPVLSWAAHHRNPLHRSLGMLFEDLAGRRRVAPIYQDWVTTLLPTAEAPAQALLNRAGKPLIAVSGTLPTRETTQGPTLLVSNHPFGIWDGFIQSALMEALGRPFRLIAYAGAKDGIPELRPYLLPIDTGGGPAAARTNRATWRSARRVLGAGGTVGIFPSGRVASAPHGFGTAAETKWHPLAARLIMDARCTVLPVYIEGQLGRFEQIARALPGPVGAAGLLTDFYRRFGEPVRLHIGDAVSFAALRETADKWRLTRELRARVFDLAPVSVRRAPAGSVPSRQSPCIGWQSDAPAHI